MAIKDLNSTARIAVIGAGMAGLSCATALRDSGFSVRLFEKSAGPSGRMTTRRGDGWQCDHGAQYFTARHPDFRAELARWQQAGVADVWKPRLHVLGGEASHVPQPELERFVGIPRMTAPARLISGALDLSTHSSIQQLKPQPDGWQLLTIEHGWLGERFDVVLLSVPAPQAAPLLRQLSAELTALARSVVMRGCWAAMLRFSSPLELGFDAAFVNHGPLRWIARDNGKPGRSGPETWLLHASAEWSEAHLEDSPDRVAAMLLQAFGELGAPVPQAWTVHRWRYADSEPPLGRGCAWDADLGLGLCGDWLNGGKVEGAWLSGRQLAQQVVESLRPDF